MIRIKNADKFFNRGRQNQLHVINHVNLELPDHGMVAIFGRSGCGKTTLLNTIGGLDSLDSGEIEFGDLSMSRNRTILRNQHIGYIFQNYNLNKGETVLENVADALRLCGMSDEAIIRERVTAALKNVGMDRYASRLPDTLSGGQQQRVAIARAIVKAPSIILADEPTGNLDEANTVMIMDLLKILSKDRLVLLVTHEANLVDLYCDRVIELVDGQVTADRQNEQTDGYRERNKNDIYLGELHCNTSKMEGVQVAYYGDPGIPIQLKIVHVNGQLYLQSDTPSLRILDGNSEVQLKEGTFHPQEQVRKKEESLDMSHLTPVEGTKFGRLFNFKRSLALAWRANYSKKRRRRDRFLRVTLMFMAFVLVFMTAASAVAIRQYTTLYENSNPNLFYLDRNKLKDNEQLSSLVGQNGIDYATCVSYYNQNERYFSFNVGNFVTSSLRLEVQGRMMPVSTGERQELVAGSGKLTDQNQILITTALADVLLENSRVSFINDYASLLGLVGNGGGDTIRGAKVVGVVRSDEKIVYCDDYLMAQNALTRINWNLFSLLRSPSQMSADAVPVQPGRHEIVYYISGMDNESQELPKVGNRETILGTVFTIRDVVTLQTYDQYCQSIGYEYPDSGTYSQKAVENGTAADEIEAYWKWFWEEYTVKFGEYCDRYRSQNPELMLYDITKDPLALTYVLGNNIQAYYAWVFRNDTGRFPTRETSEAFDKLWLENQGEYWNNFYALREQHEDALKNSTFFQQAILMNEQDVIELSYSSDFRCDSFFYTGSMSTDYYYGNGNFYLMHSSDIDATESFLQEKYSQALVTAKDVLKENMQEYRIAIIASVVTVLVVLLIMCLCVFFLMRSSLMPRVKEIGIYRAIGVSKSNLVYRFFVEAAVLSMMTVLIGYLVAAWVASTLSSASLTSGILYFPLPLAIGVFVIIMGATLLSGILPVVMLLHKTPAEILAKYDI